MTDMIKVFDQNFTAVVSLHNMVFYNIFDNITSNNNTLKILSTYKTSPTATSVVNNVITVQIPSGHWTAEQLLVYLNTPGLCNTINTTTGTGAPYWVYGMGFTGNTGTTQAAQDAWTWDSSRSKFLYSPPGAAASGIMTDALCYDPTHIYVGFYLIYDSTTEPCLDTLGLLQYSNNIPTNVVPVQGQNGNVQVISPNVQYIDYQVYLNTQTHTNYAFSQYIYVSPSQNSIYNNKTIQAPAIPQSYPYNTVDMGSISSLLISWEEISSTARNSCDSMTQGDTIAVVPVTSAYSNKITYEPKVPFKCMIPNFNINRFHLVIRDADTGLNVNFKGVDWMIALIIEFFEVDNGYRSERGQAGMYQNTMPLFHGEVMQHNLPLSGVKRRKVPYTNYMNSEREVGI